MHLGDILGDHLVIEFTCHIYNCPMIRISFCQFKFEPSYICYSTNHINHHINQYCKLKIITLTHTYQRYVSDVWFVGDSFVHWAERRAVFRQIQNSLGVKGISSITWEGSRGMKWELLMQTIQYLALRESCPKVIFIHLGSNNIGSSSCSYLRAVMKRDILNIVSMFPNAKLVVSAMLPRLVWNRTLISVDKIEKKRRYFNRFLRRLVCYLGGQFVSHEEITADTPGLFFGDGVHLSDVGTDLFLMAFKDCLETML